MKGLKDKQLRLRNKKIASANFAKKGKSKLTSHGNYTYTSKNLTDYSDQKEKYKSYCNSHKYDHWHMTAKYFQ